MIASTEPSRCFGFLDVTPEEKTKRVGGVFSSVASRYDLMNDAMSCGRHRVWKNRFVELFRPRAGERLLDVAGGTGDIALRCAQKTQGNAVLTVCDINEAMVRVGRDKGFDRGWGQAIDWVVGNAEALPFPDKSVDGLSIAFGLRNVTHIDRALAEFYRVLTNGVRFFCM